MHLTDVKYKQLSLIFETLMYPPKAFSWRILEWTVVVTTPFLHAVRALPKDSSFMFLSSDSVCSLQFWMSCLRAMNFTALNGGH